MTDDDPITYVDSTNDDPPHATHIHHRDTDRCLRAPDGVTCPTPAELRAEVERLTRDKAIYREAWHAVVRWRKSMRAERDALQQQVAKGLALADDGTLTDCECGHDLGDHNGLGCYARLTYEPLVTCMCNLTDDRSHFDVAVQNLRAALAPSTEGDRSVTTGDPQEIIDRGLRLNPDQAASLTHALLDAERKIRDVQTLVEDAMTTGERWIPTDLLVRAALGGPAAPTPEPTIAGYDGFGAPIMDHVLNEHGTTDCPVEGVRAEAEPDCQCWRTPGTTCTHEPLLCSACGAAVARQQDGGDQ